MGWRWGVCECCTPPTCDCNCSGGCEVALPVTCASFTQYQLTAACDPTDFSCAAFDVVADISFDTYWGCPWCKLDCCGACEGELENYLAVAGNL